MNLTNFNKTAPHDAFEEVRKQARKRGARVTGSELVGLIPLKAMISTGKYYLNKQKRDFLRADIGKNIYTKMEKQLSAYAVISEDEEVLITVGHRLKKVRR